MTRNAIAIVALDIRGLPEGDLDTVIQEWLAERIDQRRNHGPAAHNAVIYTDPIEFMEAATNGDVPVPGEYEDEDPSPSGYCGKHSIDCRYCGAHPNGMNGNRCHLCGHDLPPAAPDCDECRLDDTVRALGLRVGVDSPAI